MILLKEDTKLSDFILIFAISFFTPLFLSAEFAFSLITFALFILLLVYHSHIYNLQQEIIKIKTPPAKVVNNPPKNSDDDIK